MTSTLPASERIRQVDAHETTPSDAAIGQAFREALEDKGKNFVSCLKVVEERAREIEQSRGAIEWPPLPEPEGWTFQHEETGIMTTLENDGINNPDNFAANNPRFALCGTLYSEKQLLAYGEACRRMGNRDE